MAVLVWITILGLQVGKWVHTVGGVLMLTVFAMIILLPWLNVAKGTLPEFHPLATASPAISLLSLNLLGKMGFGAFGGFEYVAIHAGECRDPVRSITRATAIAAPIIVLMFMLGTSSVLALVPIDRIDLIAPIPQLLSIGFGPLGAVAAIVPITLSAMMAIRFAQASVNFAGSTRLPMVAGWDSLLPAWFTRLSETRRTPVNSILFVGAATFVLSTLGLIGVGKQEAFQLLWNSAGIFYALTYLAMFAVPFWGLARSAGAGAVVGEAVRGFRTADDDPLHQPLGAADHPGWKPHDLRHEDRRTHRRDEPARACIVCVGQTPGAC